MHKNFYNVEVPYKSGLIIYNILNKSFVFLDSEYMHFYLNKRLWGKDKSKLKEFMDLELILDDDVDERGLVLRNFNLSRWKSDKLHITIVPTNNCNFRCPYCFVDFNRKTTINKKYIREIIDYITDKISTLGSKYLELNFFGGEPLLKVDFIISVCKELERNIPSDIEWASSIFSNGYLLNEETAKNLIKKCRLSWVQITIDGPPEVHNRLRPLANGGGSFDRIFDNLKVIVELPISISLRVNLSEENVAKIDELLKILAPILKSHGNVNLNFSPIFDTTEDDPLKMMDTWRMFGDMYVNKVLPSLIKFGVPFSMFPEPIYGPCTAITPYAYVIDSDLSIKKCFEVIGAMGENVDYLLDKKTYPSAVELKWENFSLLSDECKNCKYLPLCNGGCPWNKMRTGSNICSWYRFEFENFLKKLYRLKFENQCE